MQEPITFAASRKEQLVKIIFDSLSHARKTAGNARASHAHGKENAAGVADGKGAGAVAAAARTVAV